MGRPARRLTPAQVAEVETLAAVLSAEQMADYFGIGRTTFFALMQREAGIAERYKKGRARAIGAVAQSLIAKARGGDTASMIFYLKTQGGWRETALVEHAGAIGGSTAASEAFLRLARRLDAKTVHIAAPAAQRPALAASPDDASAFVPLDAQAVP